MVFPAYPAAKKRGAARLPFRLAFEPHELEHLLDTAGVDPAGLHEAPHVRPVRAHDLNSW